jgi:hypothetical protein
MATTKKKVAKKKSDVSTNQIILPQLQLKRAAVYVVGGIGDDEAHDSEVICHAWSEKAKKMILDKQMQVAKGGNKPPKDPQQDFLDSLYAVDPETGEKITLTKDDDLKQVEFGLKCLAFKKAAVSACRNVEGVTMTLARGAFHVLGEYTRVYGDGPFIREDMVRISGNTTDIRYRGAFRNWWAKLIVQYNSGVITPEQMINLFNIAGFAVGVHEWRPERDGNFGMFHVATTEDLKWIKKQETKLGRKKQAA